MAVENWLVEWIKIHDEVQGLAGYVSIKPNVDTERVEWMDRTLKNSNVIYLYSRESLRLRDLICWSLCLVKRIVTVVGWGLWGQRKQFF